MKQKLLLLFSLLFSCFSMTIAQTPYAILDNGTLTFYYDNSKDSRVGTAYDVVSLSYNGVTYMYPYKKEVQDELPVTIRPNNETTKAVFDKSFSGFSDYNSLNGLFWEYSNLTDISGIENLNTSGVKDMSYMFFKCSSLTSLDLKSFSTENVTNMSGMFLNCSSLQNLDISSFSRASLESANEMFKGCSESLQLTTPDGWYIDDVVITETHVVVGNYTYTLYQDHHADMEGIVSNLSGDVVVSATFEYGGNTYKVKKVNSLTKMYYYNEETTKYDYASMTRPLPGGTYPDYTQVKSITFEDGIESMSDETLAYYWYCKVVNFPKSVKYISPETYYMSFLSRSGYQDETRGQGFSSAAGQVIFNDITYNVAPANSVYTSLDGVLYDKEMKTLLRCPKGKEGKFVVPDGVEIIDRFAFMHCLLLTEVQLPASVRVLGDDGGEKYVGSSRLFSHCYSLETVNIPEGVERIESMSFRYCTNLKGLTMPNSLKYYNTCALSGNNESLEYLDWQDCALETLEIYDSYAIIGNTPKKCTISLPKSVKDIICMDRYGNKSTGPMFNGGQIPETLTLPASIEKFEATQLFAFSTSLSASEILTNLTKLYVLMDQMPDIDEKFFSTDRVRIGAKYYEVFPQTWADNCTLYVPENLLSSYKAHAVWSKFTNIVGLNQQQIDDMTAIENVEPTASSVASGKIYSIDGKLLPTPQKGINIMKTSDGKTRLLLTL